MSKMKYALLDENVQQPPDTKLILPITEDATLIQEDKNILYLLPQLTPSLGGLAKIYTILWILFAVPSPKFQRHYPAELISSLGITRTVYNECITNFEDAAACPLLLRFVWFLMLPAIIGTQVYMIYLGLNILSSLDSFLMFLILFAGIQAGIALLRIFRESTNRRMDKALETINEILAKEITRTHPSESLTHPKCRFQYEYVLITLVTLVVAIDEEVVLENRNKLASSNLQEQQISRIDAPFKPENSFRIYFLEDRYDGRVRRYQNTNQNSSSCTYYLKLFFLKLLQIYPDQITAHPNMHYSPLLAPFCTEEQYKTAANAIYQASLLRSWERNFLFLHRLIQVAGIVAAITLGLKFDFGSTSSSIKSGILLAIIVLPIFFEIAVTVCVNRRLAKCIKPINISLGFPKQRGFQWKANIRIMKIYITLDTHTYLEPV